VKCQGDGQSTQLMLSGQIVANVYA
jgi:hypothetical protein